VLLWHWNCYFPCTVSDILLCTHDPMLIKGLYGILRDEGCRVDISDYPAHAVQQIMKNSYMAVIIDSHAFGMSAEDAARVIRTVAPDVKVILIGCPEHETDALSVKVPADLERVRSVVHGIHQISAISHN
jgi:DNA-binding NtrC family response regulator